MGGAIGGSEGCVIRTWRRRAFWRLCDVHGYAANHATDSNGVVCACAAAEGYCPAAARSNCGQKQPGRSAQGGCRMVVAGWLAGGVFFHAGFVSVGRGIVATDRAAIPAEHGGRRWCNAGADVAGLAGKSGGGGGGGGRGGGEFVG